MRRQTRCRWLAALALSLATAAGTADADSFVVPATLDFSVRDEGRDGFDQVLEGECCIRATIFPSFRIRGLAEFDLSSLSAGLTITSVTLRLVLVSGTGDNPADFFAYAADEPRSRTRSAPRYCSRRISRSSPARWTPAAPRSTPSFNPATRTRDPSTWSSS